jgi:hypothetical protein
MQERRVAELMRREEDAERRARVDRRVGGRDRARGKGRGKKKVLGKGKGKGKEKVGNEDDGGGERKVKARKLGDGEREWIRPSEGFGGLSMFSAVILCHGCCLACSCF